MPVDYDYTTTIYKIPNPRSRNKLMIKYTIPLINSNPCKIYIGFHKIIDIIKFRKTEEEYNHFKDIIPTEHYDFDKFVGFYGRSNDAINNYFINCQ